MFVFLIIMFNTKIIKPVKVADSARTRHMQVLLIILMFIFSQTRKVIQKHNYVYYTYLPSLY